jgi:CheY-like chemotaxis protein
VIGRQVDHLTRLVDDLLDVTRISRGRIELQRARVDLRDVVRSTCDDFRPLFERGTLQLRLEPMPDPVWIDADATRLAQVLGNLLNNAAKFTPAGGIVTVRVEASGGRAEVSVRDTGVGMELGEIKRLFEPLAQAPQGLARTRGGLGLGLALSKGLVELHGGSIQARSDGLAHGSEFLVRLPLAAPPVVSPEAPKPRAPGDRRLVLLIEDNADTCESLSLVLQLAGHQVRTAHDGKTGIATAHELKPEVVLCDIGLPDIDGYEVARRLREDQALRSTRIFALSGYARPEDKARAKEAGFDEHIAKPPDLEELSKLLG